MKRKKAKDDIKLSNRINIDNLWEYIQIITI